MGRCHIRRRSVSELRASMTRAVQTDTYMEETGEKLITRRGDVPEDLVRLVAQLEVEPAQLAVVSAHDEVVAGRVHVHGRDPARAGRQRFQERLLREVVHAHIALCLQQVQSEVSLRCPRSISGMEAEAAIGAGACGQVGRWETGTYCDEEVRF